MLFSGFSSPLSQVAFNKQVIIAPVLHKMYNKNHDKHSRYTVKSTL